MNEPINDEEEENEPQPPAELPELAEVLRQARVIPWEQVDLDCPEASISSVGAEIEEASAIIVCDCGTKFRLHLDGQNRQRCPQCKETFRHILVIQGEGFTPSAVSEALRAILEAQEL